MDVMKNPSSSLSTPWVIAGQRKLSCYRNVSILTRLVNTLLIGKSGFLKKPEIHNRKNGGYIGMSLAVIHTIETHTPIANSPIYQSTHPYEYECWIWKLGLRSGYWVWGHWVWGCWVWVCELGVCACVCVCGGRVSWPWASGICASIPCVSAGANLRFPSQYLRVKKAHFKGNLPTGV